MTCLQTLIEGVPWQVGGTHLTILLRLNIIRGRLERDIRLHLVWEVGRVRRNSSVLLSGWLNIPIVVLVGELGDSFVVVLHFSEVSDLILVGFESILLSLLRRKVLPSIANLLHDQ